MDSIQKEIITAKLILKAIICDKINNLNERFDMGIDYIDFKTEGLLIDANIKYTNAKNLYIYKMQKKYGYLPFTHFDLIKGEPFKPTCFNQFGDVRRKYIQNGKLRETWLLKSTNSFCEL